MRSVCEATELKLISIVHLVSTGEFMFNSQGTIAAAPSLEIQDLVITITIGFPTSS
jgi:hypothetical protein